MKLSEHFTLEELTNSSNHPNLVPQNMIDAQNVIKQLKHTAESLEEIRAVLGTPLIISSGYRNTTLNTAVKGSPTSKHKDGLCCDFLPKGMDLKVAMQVLIKAYKDGKLPSVRKVIFEGVKGKLWFHIQTKNIASEPTEFYTTDDGSSYTRIA